MSSFSSLLLYCARFRNPTLEGIYKQTNSPGNESNGSFNKKLCNQNCILYNIPGRTGTNMLPETVKRLADDCPTIVALKDSTGNLDQLSTLRTIMPDEFDIYSGDDSMTLPILSVGGCGVTVVFLTQ